MMDKKQRAEAKRRGRGYTLIELMIVIGILGIVSAIAIPSYRGYLTSSRQVTTRSNIEPLRLAQEDYWLDNGAYIAGDWKADGSSRTLANAPLSWNPDGDENRFDYDVTLSGATDAVITVEYIESGNVVATASSVLTK